MRLSFNLDLSNRQFIRNFGELPGAKHNRRFWQVPGCILAEIKQAEGRQETEIVLCHPNVDFDTGPIIYQPGRHEGGNSPLELCFEGNQIYLSNLLGNEAEFWPTGIANLIGLIERVEATLVTEKVCLPGNAGLFQPQLGNWLASRDQWPEPARTEHKVTFVPDQPEMPARPKKPRVVHLGGSSLPDPRAWEIKAGEKKDWSVRANRGETISEMMEKTGPGIPGPAFTVKPDCSIRPDGHDDEFV